MDSREENDIRELQVIRIKEIITPLGKMLAGANSEGLCLLEFCDRNTIDKEIQDLEKYLSAITIDGSNRYIEQVEEELSEYFNGSRTDFDVQLLTPGTAFQQKVWAFLREIPFGETISYSEQAEKVGDIKSIRAIAHANGSNRISIIIPCHRVIGKNGKMTGYGGGIDRKQSLLLHEKLFVKEKSGLFAIA